MKAFPLLKKAGCVAALLGLAACGGGGSSSSGSSAIGQYSPYYILLNGQTTGTLVVGDVQVAGTATSIGNLTFVFTGGASDGTGYTSGTVEVTFPNETGTPSGTITGTWSQDVTTLSNYIQYITVVLADTSLNITTEGNPISLRILLREPQTDEEIEALAEGEEIVYTGDVMTGRLHFTGDSQIDDIHGDTTTYSGSVNMEGCEFTYTVGKASSTTDTTDAETAG